MSAQHRDLSQADGSPEEILEQALFALADLAEQAPHAALEMLDSLPAEVKAQPEFQFELAVLLRKTSQLDPACEVLSQLLALEPEDSDAHYLLGDVLEDRGEKEQAQMHFLETLRLDRTQYRLSSPERTDLHEAIVQHLRAALTRLPLERQEPLANVKILVEDFPSPEHVKAGLDPRAPLLLEENRAPLDLPTGPATVLIAFAGNLADAWAEESLEEHLHATVQRDL